MYIKLLRSVSCITNIMSLMLYALFKTWKKCMALLGNRGQDGLRYKMSELNPDDVSRKNALDAKITIEPYTEEQLRYISPGAAAFYNWVCI